MRRRIRIRLLRVLACGLLVLAVVPVPAEAADSGTITATVTGAAPCITVSGSFAFGTLPFTEGDYLTPGTSQSQATATNCGAQAETILARLSSATNGNTTWTVTTDAPCANSGTNVYGIEVWDLPNGNTHLRMSGLDQTFLSSVAASAQQSITGAIYMPCTGSAGAGLVMTSTITLTATF